MSNPRLVGFETSISMPLRGLTLTTPGVLNPQAEALYPALSFSELGYRSGGRLPTRMFYGHFCAVQHFIKFAKFQLLGSYRSQMLGTFYKLVLLRYLDSKTVDLQQG